MPPDAFEQFVSVLRPGYRVVTGRSNQRVWRIGGIESDEVDRVLTARLGFQPLVEEGTVPDWSEEEKDWVPVTAGPREPKLIPFGFDGDTRVLAVLRESSSRPTTIAAVFEKTLQDNEAALPAPTTRWSVEPILDTREFLEWLNSLEYVRSVSFTAKLPNPEPREEFSQLWARLQHAHATELSETIKSDRDEGLVAVSEDPDVKQAIAMGQQGFASLRGRGRRAGTVTTFSQNEDVAREPIPELPDSWPQMRQLIRDFLKNQARRFLGQEAA
jgi:hypothetical protein